MSKFRKKPVVIEAIKWTVDNFESEFLPLVLYAHEIDGSAEHYTLHNGTDLVIHTLEGDMRVSFGDYIIVGVNGEMYPCKPDIFEKTYEAVE